MWSPFLSISKESVAIVSVRAIYSLLYVLLLLFISPINNPKLSFYVTMPHLSPSMYLLIWSIISIYEQNRVVLFPSNQTPPDSYKPTSIFDKIRDISIVETSFFFFFNLSHNSLFCSSRRYHFPSYNRLNWFVLAYFILKDKQTCPELTWETIWKY